MDVFVRNTSLQNGLLMFCSLVEKDLFCPSVSEGRVTVAMETLIMLAGETSPSSIKMKTIAIVSSGDYETCLDKGMYHHIMATSLLGFLNFLAVNLRQAVQHVTADVGSKTKSQKSQQ